MNILKFVNCICSVKHMQYLSLIELYMHNTCMVPGTHSKQYRRFFHYQALGRKIINAYSAYSQNTSLLYLSFYGRWLLAIVSWNLGCCIPRTKRIFHLSWKSIVDQRCWVMSGKRLQTRMTLCGHCFWDQEGHIWVSKTREFVFSKNSNETLWLCVNHELVTRKIRLS